MEPTPAVSIDRIRLSLWVVLTALGLGLANTLLMFEQLPALGYSLFVIGTVLVVATVAPRLAQRPLPAHAWWLLGSMAIFGILITIRANELLILLNMAAVMYVGLLLVSLWRGQSFSRLTPMRYLLLWLTPIEFVIRSLGTLATTLTNPFGAHQSEKTRAIIRGLLLTLPVVVIFLLLLSSADVILGTYLERLLNIDTWFTPETVGRFINIIFVTIFFTGTLTVVVWPTESPEPAPIIATNAKPSLGVTEQLILLSALGIIFGMFIILQVRYLFLGAAALPLGYTYAEYARRGFFELIVVAGLAFAILWTMHKTDTERGEQGRWFHWLSLAVIAEVILILLSAAKRLILYEQAYGFTVARFWAHALIIWLGLILIGFAWLAVKHGNQQRFTQFLAGSLLVGLLAINLVNPDRFVAKENFALYERTGRLDSNYVAYQLSSDSVPIVAREVHDIDDTFQQLNVLRALYDKHEQLKEAVAQRDWRSWHVSDTRALTILEREAAFLAQAKDYTPGNYVCIRPEAAGDFYHPIPEDVIRERDLGRYCAEGTVPTITISPIID